MLPNVSPQPDSQITVVEPGRLTFISGQVAWRTGGEPVPDTLTGQAEVVVANAKATLAAVGASSHDLAMVRVYMTDLTPARLKELMPHIMILFDGTQPSFTGVGMAALASPNLQLEIEITVRLPS